jgi:hypothetical protein
MKIRRDNKIVLFIYIYLFRNDFFVFTWNKQQQKQK